MIRRLGIALALLVLQACAGGEAGGDDGFGLLAPVDAAVSTSTNAASADAGAVVPGASDASASGPGMVARTDGGSLLADGSLVAALDAGSGAIRPVDSGRASVDAGTSSSDSGTVATTPVDTGGFMRGPMPTKESASKNGPYRVQSSTSGFRNGPNFSESTLWWPTDAEPPFAIVAVVPGWVSTEGDIKEWGPFLASHGIVAMTAGTNDPLGDLPPDRKAALLDILVTLRAENTRAGGPLVGKLDVTRQATMGWSMGGGGSLLAAEETPTLKAAISMCGWNPAYDASKVKVPSLMFASEGDPLAGGQSQWFYDTMPAATPKLLWEAPGGDHWLFNTPKNLSGAVGRYGLSWLKVYLENDKRYAPFLKEQPAQKTDFKNNL